ncbi:hypothetical protein LTR37_017065 [Vermiconidia calcicola]|uniref:Uncharacterized protein n=1 Tax=Vermiconidia calcicola TaxID=1690605 RepID=A0ACC3ML28_9PEZI|nr:hypothetical protein LTR37_017065 [Vermiconidia calcicola]
MSGIEVAGLVLGVFPLVICALEFYQDAHKDLGQVGRFEFAYRKALEDVKDEQLVFLLTLEQLLLPLTRDEVLDEDGLAGVLADPKAPGWNEPDVADALQKRLGLAYSRFVEISTSLHSLISRLLVTLISDKPQLQEKIKATTEARLVVKTKSADSLQSTEHKSCLSSDEQKLSAAALQTYMKNQWHYRKQQIEFGMGKPQRDEILREIHKHNKKLEGLLEKSDNIARFDKRKTAVASPKAVRSLLQYWQHADRVYALIHHSWGSLAAAQNVTNF